MDICGPRTAGDPGSGLGLGSRPLLFFSVSSAKLADVRQSDATTAAWQPLFSPEGQTQVSKLNGTLIDYVA
jgi:hypothetical protein